MPMLYHHPDIVGNRDDTDMMQGWTFPLPDDDTWACDGTERSNRGNTSETNTSFAEEAMDPFEPSPKQSQIHAGILKPDTMVICEGDNSHSTTVWGRTHRTYSLSTHSPTNANQPGIPFVAGEQQHTQRSYPFQMTSAFTEHPLSTLEATHGHRLTLTGGAPDHPSSTAASGHLPE